MFFDIEHAIIDMMADRKQNTGYLGRESTVPCVLATLLPGFNSMAAHAFIDPFRAEAARGRTGGVWCRAFTDIRLS